MTSSENRTILLTGATGYVGGLLLPALSQKFRHVRCMTRNPSSIASGLEDGVTAIYGDTADQGSLIEARSSG